MTKSSFVLVVEDEPWLAEQHIRVLKSAGFRAESVPHALAAIDAIDHATPDVLVLDVFLAGSNALVLLHELQSYPDLAAIPVILCTTSADNIAPVTAEAYGVRHILNKTTMHPDDLVTAVRKVTA